MPGTNDAYKAMQSLIPNTQCNMKPTKRAHLLPVQCLYAGMPRLNYRRPRCPCCPRLLG